VQHADLALYRSKARGRDGWSFYEAAGPYEDQQLERLKTAS
jgi:hypothetical protein